MNHGNSPETPRIKGHELPGQVPMTHQDMMDKIIRGFEAQGWAMSINDGGTCLYRGPNGLKCAVGHLIPDDKYSRDMEGCTVGALKANFSSALPLGIDLDFLAEVQTAHDSFYLEHLRTPHEVPERLRKEMRRLVTSVKLKWPEDVP